MSSKWTDEDIKKLKQAINTYSNQEIADEVLPSRSKNAVTHKIRRLGLERPKNFTARKKIRQAPNPNFPDSEFNNFISGFVAGEGTFTYRNASTRDGKRFAFQIAVADVDREILERIRDYLGVGNIYEQESRDKEWKPTVQYQVQGIGEIASIIIPFFDKVGLYSTNKQDQYKEWRSEFLEYYNITERFK